MGSQEGFAPRLDHPPHSSPNFAFLPRIHRRAQRTVELVRELSQIAEGANHAELGGGMRVLFYLQISGLVSGAGTPNLRTKSKLLF